MRAVYNEPRSSPISVAIIKDRAETQWLKFFLFLVTLDCCDEKSVRRHVQRTSPFDAFQHFRLDTRPQQANSVVFNYNKGLGMGAKFSSLTMTNTLAFYVKKLYTIKIFLSSISSFLKVLIGLQVLSLLHNC